jgi:hypothetical protein
MFPIVPCDGESEKLGLSKHVYALSCSDWNIYQQFATIGYKSGRILHALQVGQVCALRRPSNISDPFSNSGLSVREKKMMRWGKKNDEKMMKK